MRDKTPPALDYPTILHAIGSLIQEEHLTEISILEFDRGWVVHGLTYRTTAQGFIRVPVDKIYTHDQVREAAQQAASLTLQLGRRR